MKCYKLLVGQFIMCMHNSEYNIMLSFGEAEIAVQCFHVSSCWFLLCMHRPINLNHAHLATIMCNGSDRVLGKMGAVSTVTISELE